MMALYGKKDQEEHDTLDPIFGSLSEEQDLPCLLYTSDAADE